MQMPFGSWAHFKVWLDQYIRDRLTIYTKGSGGGPNPQPIQDKHLILSPMHVDTDTGTTPSEGDVLTWDDTLAKWKAAPPGTAPLGGDLSGLISDAAVVGLYGIPLDVSMAAPNDYAVPQYYASDGRWHAVLLPEGDNGFDDGTMEDYNVLGSMNLYGWKS